MPERVKPKVLITFSDARGNPTDPFDPHTNGRDESLFGQGRSLERQARNQKGFSSLTVTLAMLGLALSAVWFLLPH